MFYGFERYLFLEAHAITYLFTNLFNIYFDPNV